MNIQIDDSITLKTNKWIKLFLVGTKYCNYLKRFLAPETFYTSQAGY